MKNLLFAIGLFVLVSLACAKSETENKMLLIPATVETTPVKVQHNPPTETPIPTATFTPTMTIVTVTTCTVIAEVALNVRSGPSNQKEVLDNLKNGDKIIVTELHESWAKVENSGWVHVAYLECEEK